MASFRRVLTSSTSGTFSSLKAVCSCLPHGIKGQIIFNQKSGISTSSYTLKVINHSTILVQDGVSFQELPVLIRRADRGSFPFASHSYSGENIREVNEFEMSFKQVLHDCATVSDVFKLLEVPSDKVEGYSAAFALQRLHALMHMNTEWLQIHSFIRTAVMRELYETVQTDIQLISNSTLISLVDCYLAAQGFSPSCLNAINDEISFRLVAGVFSLEELLALIQSLSTSSSRSTENIFPTFRDLPSLSEILFENASKFLSSVPPSNEKTEPFDKFIAMANPKTKEEVNQKCDELTRNAWIHLATRYQELNENSLPLTLQLLAHEKKSFVHLLEKPLSNIWYHLSAEGASVCLDNLLRLRVHNSALMSYLGKWAYVNIHLVTPRLLLSFLNVYIRFTHLDKNIIQVMERCLKKTGPDAPTDLLALCVEYLRSFNYISPLIMDLAAVHFSQHWESYAPVEIYAVLRAFGQLRYLPADCQDFLREAENCLHKRFDFLDEVHLLEVLASFTFVDVLPKNFYGRITSDFFFKKIGDLPKLSKVQALLWLKAMQHAVVLSSSTNKDVNRRWVFSQKSKSSIFFFLESERMAIRILKSGLDELLGPRFYHFIPFYSCCAIYVDENGVPLEITKNEKDIPTPNGVVHERLVLLLRTAAHFSTNIKHLLGAQAQKKSHLEQLGFTSVEIRVPELNCLQPSTVLQSYLSSHVNFSLPEVQHLLSERSKQCEEQLANWSYNFEEEDCEEDYSSGDEDINRVFPNPTLFSSKNWESLLTGLDNNVDVKEKNPDSDSDNDP